MAERTAHYPDGQLLRHHGGSVWEVVECAPNGDYRIRCMVGTKREGWIGGEAAGVVRTVHPDYLHGDGWRLEGVGALRASSPEGGE